MALIKYKNELSKDASLEELQEAISGMGPVKVNKVMKTLGLNPRGRKSQDVFEVGQAINKGKLSLETAINAFNSEIKDMNNRREKVKEFFTKENIEDIFDDFGEWINFAFELGKQLFK